MKKLLAGLLLCAVAFVLAAPALAQAFPHLSSVPVTFRKQAINTTGTMPSDPRTVTYSSTAAYIDSLSTHHVGQVSSTIYSDTTTSFTLQKVLWTPNSITPAADSTLVLGLNLVGDGTTFTADSIGGVVIQRSVGGGDWVTVYTLDKTAERTSGKLNFFLQFSKATWNNLFAMGSAMEIRAIIKPCSTDVVGLRGYWVFPVGD
jgi:hypothetical protein